MLNMPPSISDIQQTMHNFVNRLTLISSASNNQAALQQLSAQFESYCDTVNNTLDNLKETLLTGNSRNIFISPDLQILNEIFLMQENIEAKLKSLLQPTRPSPCLQQIC